MKKYYDKVSIKSKIINFLFKFCDVKNIFMSEAKTKKYIKKLNKKNEKYNTPEKLGMNIEKIDSNIIYTYNGSIKNNNGNFILYIHGGSYIEEAISYQIKFAMKIAKKTNSTLIMPKYILAPKGNYKKMYSFIDEIYNLISQNDCRIEFLGDSAGGGFILSYAMYLRETKRKQSKNIIMMSPWLDISMSNKDLYIAEKKDPISGVDGNKYAGKLWADDLELTNYLVSPMYGEFNDLGKITIITGENDILKPDCKKLSKKLDKFNIEHNYIEYKGQAHDFGAYPTKEGKLVIDDIVNIIKIGDKNEK